MTVVVMGVTRAPLFEQSRITEHHGKHEILQHAAGRR